MPGRGRLLIIDDDRDFCSDLGAVFAAAMVVEVAYDGEAGLKSAEEFAPDVVLLDVGFGPGHIDGLETLERLRALDDPPVIIMLSGARDIQTVVRAIKRGAFHYVTKPADVSQLDNLITQALAVRQGRHAVRGLADEVGRLTGNFIAGDDKTFAILDRIRKVAPLDTTVLITGESGVGKEMIARRIHAESGRRNKPFLGMNCGAIPAELIESEIFGHARGSFTGADKARVGKMEQAAGGHLFLDEIGESPVDFQVALLRAIGEKVFNRVGENLELPLTCRLLAATSEDLERAVERGTFREALYYRLDRYRIHVPPLRERPGDIEPLAMHFLAQFCREFRKQIDGFSPAAMQRLLSDPWKGNVRELRNRIEVAVIECEGSTITLGDLAGGLRDRPAESGRTLRYKEALEDFQRQFVTSRLTETGGNVTHAAEISGMTRQQFQKKMKQLDISSEEFR